MVDVTHRSLCIYGHFYQPPREDPFTGHIPLEPGATPYDNFNEKITAECYAPNAEVGNFQRISFDIGPTLASWLENKHPAVYQHIIGAERRSWERFGVGNALAHPYFHTILPLATARDKRTQIVWGLTDFANRFGHQAEGMWLAETAVDLETLDILADQGVRYTVLSPWQAAEPVDPTEPYCVRLPGGRSIAVFLLNGPLSNAVSFDEGATTNADTFALDALPAQLNRDKQLRGEDQVIVVGTDGELYGHHKPYRDRFLTHLTRQAVHSADFELTSLGRYLHTHLPKRTVRLTTPSAWSCPHGVSRWSTGCSCTEDSSMWKPALRSAFQRLAERLDNVFEHCTAATLGNPWEARDQYIALYASQVRAERPDARHCRCDNVPDRARAADPVTRALLDAQYYAQGMFTSCGWFFEDVDRIEARNDLAYARKAISLVWQATGVDLQRAFLADLATVQSWRSALTAADIYLRLPHLGPKQLPRSGNSEDSPVA
jgi:hypothetical protein